MSDKGSDQTGNLLDSQSHKGGTTAQALEEKKKQEKIKNLS